MVRPRSYKFPQQNRAWYGLVRLVRLIPTLRRGENFHPNDVTVLRRLRSHVTLPKSQNPGKMLFVTLLPLLPLFSRPPGGKKIPPRFAPQTSPEGTLHFALYILHSNGPRLTAPKPPRSTAKHSRTALNHGHPRS